MSGVNDLGRTPMERKRLTVQSKRPLTRWQVAGLVAAACIRKAQALSRLD